MKKTIMLLLVVALAFSCFALVFTAGAKTELVQGTQPEGKDYFITDEYVRNLTFESNDVATGIGPDSVTGTYLALENGGSFDIVSDGAISGNKSLKVTNTGFAWATRLFYVNRFGSLLQNGQTYRMSFSVKTNGATLISAEVRMTEAHHNADAFLADFRYKITNDEQGNPISVGIDLTGWTGAAQKYTNGNCYIDEDGIIRVSFDFFVPADAALAEDIPNVKIFGANVDGGTATYIFDDIQIQNIREGNKYWTIDYNADFDTEATSASSFWSAIGKISNEYTDSSAYVIDVEDANKDTRGFLINGQEGGTKPDPILKDYSGWIYFQYYVVTTAEKVALWNPGTYWSEVNYNEGTWSIGGVGIKDFQATRKGEGFTLSYFQRFEANTPVRIDMQGPGFIAFDDVIVAHEDNAPYVESGKTYNFSNPKDVQLNVELKGKTISEIKLDNVKLEESDYTLEGNTLTVKAAKFATQTVGKTFALEVTTAGGTAKTEITQNDNRPTATVTASADLTKVYDGTTTFVPSKVTYSISGIQIGARVELDCKVGQLASKNVGTTKLTITVALKGEDAWKYKLANDTVEVDVTITKKTVTLKATDTTKVYDGTTAANATLTLNGLEGNDQVTATATQTLANKNAGATKLQLTNIVLEGADKDNYAIAETTAEFDFTVTKKEITVKANAVSKDEKKADPELTYTVDGLISGDALSGALARQAGEKAGEYDITIGTLANDNYTINFTGAKLTINEAKGCFGVVGAASIGVFALIVAGAYVFTRKKND